MAKQEFQKIRDQEMVDMTKGHKTNGQEEDGDKGEDEVEPHQQMPSSFSDFVATTMRILRNKIFMLNLIGIAIFFFSCLPYWIFMAKYIEVQYRISASEAKWVSHRDSS